MSGTVKVNWKERPKSSQSLNLNRGSLLCRTMKRNVLLNSAKGSSPCCRMYLLAYQAITAESTTCQVPLSRSKPQVFGITRALPMLIIRTDINGKSVAALSLHLGTVLPYDSITSYHFERSSGKGVNVPEDS